MRIRISAGALAVGVLFISACGGLPTDDDAVVVAAGTVEPAGAAAVAEAVAVMPDVVGTNLQDAQDIIQDAGVFYSRSEDATGEGRRQVIDGNWTVVRQEPAPGTQIEEGDPLLYVVKDGEPAVPPTTTTTTTAPATTAPPATTHTSTTSTTTDRPTTTTVAPATTTPPTTIAALIVTHVVDGDTVDMSDGSRIRLIGIDTPERGECGYDEATAALAAIVMGNAVTLTPGARDDADRYGRLLRYLDVAGGTDANLIMIEQGYAIARYDSRDGYGRHAREDVYVASDAANSNALACSAPPPEPTPQPEPAPQTTPDAGTSDPWNQPGPDLDCVDIGRKVPVLPPDYHRLDRDGDGWGCESYG